METMIKSKMVNGVNVNQLFETIDAIKGSPVLAKFRFRANNKWLGGGHNRTTINDFHGTCKDMTHAKPMMFDADEPAILLGKDRGANPVEYLLTALAACVTTATSGANPLICSFSRSM